MPIFECGIIKMCLIVVQNYFPYEKKEIADGMVQRIRNGNGVAPLTN